MDQHLGVFALLFVSITLAAAVTDWRTGQLPNSLNLALFLSGLGFALTRYGSGVIDGLMAACLGGGALMLISGAYFLLRKRAGLGGGDVKFVAACGPWIGLMGLAPMIFLAATSALAFAIILVATGREITGGTEIRFGPFLGAGAILVWTAQVSGVAPFIFGGPSQA